MGAWRPVRTTAAIHGLVAVLSIPALPVARSRGVEPPACTADCGGNGIVEIDELVAAVDIALGRRPPTGCEAADTDRDGAVSVGELVLAVRAAVDGCPSPPPTDSATPSRTPSSTPSATPSDTPSSSPTPTDTPTSTQTDTATSTATPTATQTDSATSTPTATPTATQADTPASTATPSRSPTRSATLSPSTTPSSTATVSDTGTNTTTPTATPTRTATRTATATHTRTGTITATATPSASGTATPTATVGLGVRRFSVNPNTSPLVFVSQDSPYFPLHGFHGHLDLRAGVPDPETGEAVVDVVGASEYVSLDLNPGIPFTVCLRPLVPVARAGVLACLGGMNLSSSARQDHHLGEVGVDGFQEADCVASGGAVEGPGASHPGVCNGPIEFGLSDEADSGPGALLIGPDPGRSLVGLPAELTVETALPCGDEGAGSVHSFVFVTGRAASRIEDVNDAPGVTLSDEERGENFSCQNWTQENGPGRLVLSVPALHGLGVADVITVYVLDD